MAVDDLLRKGKRQSKQQSSQVPTHGKSNGKGAGVGGFQHLGLSPLIFRGVMAMGYKVPTPIQRKSLPIVLSGKDCVAMARTGSGKTAAFLIPMLEKLQTHSTKIGVRALILSPTRELAVQTLKFAKSLAKFTSLKCALIVGGEGIDQQFDAIAANPDILVATPGRLMHLLQEIPDFNLKAVEYVVFDEADRIFEMGFAEQLQEILKNMPIARQTLLFSATLPKALVQFARAGLSDPELIRLDVENKISENLKMAFFNVRSADKPALFLYLVREFLPKDDQTIVFTATRHHVEFLTELLAANHIECSSVYGDMDQASRKINIGKFRARKTSILIVTDVAARGIDIPLLNNVLNYTFPPTAKLYVHRVGRAARAGRSGVAFNFVDPDETPFMVDLHLYIGRRLEESSPANAKPYSLNEMEVSDIHYGTFPNDIIDEETEHLQDILKNNSQVSPLVKVCANAFKMYTRTRADPSKSSIQRGKQIFEMGGNKIHPLFLAPYVKPTADSGKYGNTADIMNSKYAKVAYIESLQSFRPPQTIFELANGPRSIKKTAPTAIMMQSKRKLHEKIIQTEQQKKGKQQADPNSIDDVNKANENETGLIQEVADKLQSAAKVIPTNGPEKDFLSKHERKVLKKKVASGMDEAIARKQIIASREAEKSAPTLDDLEALDGNATSFKDEDNYISYMKKSDHDTEQFLSKNADGGKVNSFAEARLEEAILDVNPDEAIEMNKKRRILHWDVRKKKYIKTTAGELTSRGTLKRKNESGVAVGAGRLSKLAVGDLYKKWQQKNNKKHRTIVGAEEGNDDTPKLDYRFGRKPKQMNNSTRNVNKHAKDELLSEGKIRKEEARKARSRGVKVSKKPKTSRGKGNIRGKTHGAPTRSKVIRRK